MFEIVSHHLWTVSWQVCVLAALALITERIYRNAPPSFRYWLWMLVLARMCVPVEIVLPTGMQGYIRESAGQVAAHFRKTPEPAVIFSRSGTVLPEMTEASVADESPVLPESARSEPRRAPVFPEALALIGWMGISLLMIMVGLTRSVMVRKRLERCSPVVRADLLALLDHLRSEMGIRRPVGIRRLETGGLNSPAVGGVLRSCIWLPPDIADSWTAKEVEPILLHELAHVRRGDLMVNLFQGIVQAVYFFHPAVWYANREIRCAREEICDDLALSRLTSGRRGYTRSLLRVVARSSGSGAGLAALALTERKSGAAARIRRIMSARYRNAPRLTVRTAALVALIGAAGLSLASPNSGGRGKAGNAGNPESTVTLGKEPDGSVHSPEAFPETAEYARVDTANAPDSGNVVGADTLRSNFTASADEPGKEKSFLQSPEMAPGVESRNSGQAFGYRSVHDSTVNGNAEASPHTIPDSGTRFAARIPPVSKGSGALSDNTLHIGLAPGVSIRPGSERVIVNGDTLSRNTDYRIDYNKGRITFSSSHTASIHAHHANIEVSYEELAARTGDAASPGSGNREAVAVAVNPGETGEGNASEDESFREALNLVTLKHDHSQGTIDRFQRFIERYPRSARVPEAKYYIAFCRYNLRQFREAVTLFESFLQKYPDHEFAPEALFHLADSQCNLGNFKEAVKGFDALMERYPGSKKAEESLFTKGWTLLDLREKEKAVETFNRLIGEYPNGRFASGARSALEDLRSPKGDSPEALREYDDARKSFEKALERREGTSAAPVTIVPASSPAPSAVQARKEFGKACATYDRAKQKKNRTLYCAAVEQFLKVIKRYPGTAVTLEAYIRAMACYEAAGEGKRVDELHGKFLDASREGGIVLPPVMDPLYPAKQ